MVAGLALAEHFLCAAVGSNDRNYLQTTQL